MLIELKSSLTDPMNTPSRMLQRFKETIILKPNSKVALQSALITTNHETYAVLDGLWKIAGSETQTATFDSTGANDYWKYKIGTDEYWKPTAGNKWLVYNTAPTLFDRTPDREATFNVATNTIVLNKGNYITTDRVVARKQLKDHNEVVDNDNTILLNITNFPINSRNASGNTDNHVATIPLLTDLNDTSKELQFYEPYNPTTHSLDNQADLNLNFIEVELLNANGTQRTDLLHPIQITLRITNEISSN